jgi:hypothetical protein
MLPRFSSESVTSTLVSRACEIVSGLRCPIARSLTGCSLLTRISYPFAPVARARIGSLLEMVEGVFLRGAGGLIITLICFYCTGLVSMILYSLFTTIRLSFFLRIFFFVFANERPLQCDEMGRW